MNNHSFTLSELNKSYDSKGSLGGKRASINDIPSKEYFYRETLKHRNVQKKSSPQREAMNRNTLQDFSSLKLREDLHSSFDTCKPKIPKINIGAIRKSSAGGGDEGGAGGVGKVKGA